MTDDAVPSDEMRWTPRPEIDPIDAVTGSEDLDEDLTDVAAIVHDLRSTYLPTGPMRRSPALAAFTEPSPEGELVAVGGPVTTGANVSTADENGRTRNRMLSTVGTFVATVTGKVVLGTAVAAAGVGGLHAAEVVDVPALPDRDRAPAEASAGDASARGPAEGAEAAADPGVEGREAAEAYTDAVREFTDCVATNAAAQGDEETRTTGAFDPRDGCGEHPRPQDFGLAGPPEGVPAPDGPETPAPAGDRPSSPGEVPDVAADASGSAGEQAEERPSTPAPGGDAGAGAPEDIPAPDGDGDSPADGAGSDRRP